MIVVDYVLCWVVLGLIALFYCMSAGHHSDSNPDSRCVPIFCLHDYRAFWTVQAVLQTATNRGTGSQYFNSHELVDGGGGGNSDAVRIGVDTAADVTSVSTLIHLLCAFFVSCAIGCIMGRHRAFPPGNLFKTKIRIFLGFLQFL